MFDRATCFGGPGNYPDRDELKREYPDLGDEDIRQALAFAVSMLDDKVLPLPAIR